MTEARDGSFHGFVQSPDDADPVLVCVEMDELKALLAAIRALAERSGHTACSRFCSGWEADYHAVE